MASSDANTWDDDSGYSLETILETLGLANEELFGSAEDVGKDTKPVLLTSDSLSKLELAPPVPEDEEGLSNVPLTESQKKNLAKRELIVREMHATEKSYTESLQTAVMLFLLPLRRKAGTPDEVATGAELDRVFANIEQLVTINNGLLKKMSVRLATWNDDSQWGDILLQELQEPQFLEAYQMYINNYPHSCETVGSLTASKNSKFSRFVSRALVNDLCQNQSSLNTFLITPVQRLPRYILFLKDLLSCTEQSHRDALNIEKALDALKSLTGKIHAAQDMYEQVSHVETLYNRFSGDDRAKVRKSNEPSRVLIKEGAMLQKDGAKYHVLYCILFSDCIVGAVKARKGRLKLKWIMNLSNCSFSEANDPNAGIDFLLCTQRKLEEFPFTVQSEVQLTGIAGSPYDAEAWLKAFESSCLVRHDNRAALARSAQATRAALGRKLFTRAEWDKLLLGATTQLYQTDDLCYDGGKDADYLAVVLSGRLQVQYEGDTCVLQVDSLGPYQFVGASALINISPTRWSAVAVEPTSVARVPLAKVRSVLASDAQLSGRFMHLVCLVYAARHLTSHLSEAAQATPTRTNSRRMTVDAGASPLVSRKAKPDKAAVKLVAKLGVPNETVVDSFPAKLKKSMFNFGTLVVMKEHVAFMSKTFGHSTRIVLPGRCICEVVARDDCTIFVNHIKAGQPALELAFKSADIKDKAFPLLSSFLSVKKMQQNITPSHETRGTLLMSGSEREELLSHAVSMDFMTGAVILEQGQICQFVYQLVEGKCAVQGLVNGQVQRFGTIEPGELFGEISFIAGTVASASVVAEGDVTVLAFGREKLESIFNENPGCATGFYTSMARLVHKRIAMT